MDITAGDDFVGLGDQKVHKSMFTILDGYRVMVAWNLELNVKITENKCNKLMNKHNAQ